MPLVLLITGTCIGHLFFNELVSVLGGLCGLIAGFYLVRRFEKDSIFETSPILLSVLYEKSKNTGHYHVASS